jgi:hypothetical protein
MGFRYVDRQLTSQPLLPWPMEERIQRELGVSANAIWNKYASGDKNPLPTPVATPTPQPSATPTPVVTPTPLPPPVRTHRVNVPLFEVAAGDPQLDANNWAVVSLGKVSSGSSYADLRIVGRTDGVMLRGQFVDRQPKDADVLTVELNGVTKRVPYTGAPGWEVAHRCSAADCRGWSVYGFFPWADFGGKPQPGAVWPLKVTFDDTDSGPATRETWPPVGSGTLRWGLPLNAGQNAAKANYLTIALSGDSMLGGGTDCGKDDASDYFSSWGKRNWGSSPHVNIQMQWDIADWPCYSKYYAQWPLSDLPPNTTVISATVEMRQFGNPGYGSGYGEDATKDTVMQVYDVNTAWAENGISWDNAPVPLENTNRTLVKPLPMDCQPTPGWYCSPGIPYQFDVTEIVRRAQLSGRDWASMAIYTAAGQYHSGKYFYSREGTEPPVVRIAYVNGAPQQQLPDMPELLFLPSIKSGQD